MKYVFLLALFVLSIVEVLFILFDFSIYILVLTIVLDLIILGLYLLRNRDFVKIVYSSVLALSVLIFNVFAYFNNKPHVIKYVVHAGGMYEDNEYLNSVQNFEYYLQLGAQYIELDFALTDDDKIFCTHNFEYINEYSFKNRPTYAEICNYKIAGMYDVLTFDYLLNVLKDNKKVKIVVDTKEQDNKKLLTRMCEEAEKQNVRIKNRLIPQVYSFENFEDVKDFKFKEFWFSNYKAKYSPETIIEHFENEYKITTYVMKAGDFNTFYENVETNKKVAVHTVNEKTEIDKFEQNNVDYVFSDYYKL